MRLQTMNETVPAATSDRNAELKAKTALDNVMCGRVYPRDWRLWGICVFAIIGDARELVRIYLPIRLAVIIIILDCASSLQLQIW